MKSIIIKSLFNGVASLLAIAMVQNLAKGVAFEKALAAPFTIVLAAGAVVGSFIGFRLKAMEK